MRFRVVCFLMNKHRIPMRKITQIDRKCRMTLQTAATTSSIIMFSSSDRQPHLDSFPSRYGVVLGSAIGRDHCVLGVSLCV
ncbi:uncharacterized protein G2W53_038214 [Senna tora]|uniref:Uncharacterized protein n=1 Tax=Senna tora TaxID=362788 RepID=A0A834SNP8_9FABA|nr:uncharacterized protein G2W53_038214 [Senna tora]